MPRLVRGVHVGPRERNPVELVIGPDVDAPHEAGHDGCARCRYRGDMPRIKVLPHSPPIVGAPSPGPGLVPSSGDTLAPFGFPPPLWRLFLSHGDAVVAARRCLVLTCS